MKTPLPSRMVPVTILAAAMLGMASSLPAADPSIPVIAIRATFPETREPLCDPAICDAALPAPGVFVVSRRGGDLARELSVLLTYEGTAMNGTDYSTLPATVSFGAGVETVQLFVEAAFDRLPEGEESVLARLQPDPSLGPIERYRLDPTQTEARVTIWEGNTPPVSVVSIEATSPIAEESSFPLRRLALRGRFTITRTGPTDTALNVFVLYRGTATAGIDYPALPWLVSIPAGTNRVELEVVPKPDDLAEPIEIIEAELSQCPPDTVPPLGIPCYLVNLDPARSTARIFVRDDGITTASLELTSPREGAEFAVGQSIAISAAAIDLDGAITRVEFFDADRKIGESEIVFIRQPDPGTPIYHEFVWTAAAPGTHELTARAVDANGNVVVSPQVHINVGESLPIVSIEATVPETTEPSPNTRVRPGVFTLRRTGDLSQALRVWVYYEGTAMSGSDYATPPTVVEFLPGAGSVEVLIGPIDDEWVEGDESVIAELGPSPLAVVPNYRVDPAKSRAQVTIHDNELAAAPTVSIRATQPNTSEPCPVCFFWPGVFAISRTGSTNDPLSVWYRLEGTAKNGEDYLRLSGQALIPAGRDSVEVVVIGALDSLREGDETVVARLYVPEVVIQIFPPPPDPYQIDPEHAEATVIIRDYPFTPADSEVSIVATDALAREGADSNVQADTATFVVTRSGNTNNALAVHFSVGGTASHGVDYETLSSPLLIPAGARRAPLVVRPVNDVRVEPIETVVVTLLADDSFPADYSLGLPRRAAALILDHDRPRPPCLRLPDGLFNVCLLGETNDCVRVEATRDFIGWTPLCILPVNQGVAHFVDPDAPGIPNRFYRLVPVRCDP